jgi:hypothetical protein
VTRSVEASMAPAASWRSRAGSGSRAHAGRRARAGRAADTRVEAQMRTRSGARVRSVARDGPAAAASSVLRSAPSRRASPDRQRPPSRMVCRCLPGMEHPRQAQVQFKPVAPAHAMRWRAARPECARLTRRRVLPPAAFPREGRCRTPAGERRARRKNRGD